jgi:hypothetical protein
MLTKLELLKQIVETIGIFIIAGMLWYWTFKLRKEEKKERENHKNNPSSANS